VSELIAEALAHERKRLQREVDVLRAMQAETRAQQGALRAALDVVRAQLRSRGDEARVVDTPASPMRRDVH